MLRQADQEHGCVGSIHALDHDICVRTHARTHTHTYIHTHVRVCVTGCSLGFDKSDKHKYSNAKTLIKGKKVLKHDEVMVILLSVREKCRPVTIVDHLRRRQVENPFYCYFS